MIKYNCLNPISEVGLARFTGDYTKTENFDEADVVLVRSAAMHDMALPDSLLAVARAGAGVNNIPLDKCAENNVTEWSVLKGAIRDSLGRFLYERTRRRPMILPIIMEI